MSSETPTWPAYSYESRDWESSEQAAPVPRSIRAQHRGPYRAAVAPKIAAARVDLAEHAALVDDAAIQLSRFDAELGAVPPFAATLLRSESASSSQIENLTSSPKALALSELGRKGKSNADLIVSNVQVMRSAMAIEEVTETTILGMHDVLMRDHWPRIAGRWRDQQVWIGGYGYGPHLADYVAPHHDRVPDAMADLVEFCRRTDLPVIGHAAVAHAQFKAIHPFPDGNGRTGRSLLHAMLRIGRLTTNAPAPVSAGLLGDVDGYFAALGAFRAGDIGPIVEAVANASFAAVANSRRLLDDLRAIRADWDDLIHARRGAAAWRIADLVLQQPVIDMPYVRDQLGITSANAQIGIDRLVTDAVLAPVGSGRRDRVWQSTAVLDALESFAARSHRRGGV